MPRNEPCSFCERTAVTKEHVVPKWLQSHFSLSNQRLGLWNGTSIPYRQAVVPSCLPCNNERFSRLENRVQNRQATLQELYLWALKIRYGLALRDSTLHLDRRSPHVGPLVEKHVATYGRDFILHAFRALDNAAFTFEPCPFGSVFRFRHLDNPGTDFGLIDVPPPYWALAVVLPGQEIVVVLFADRGATQRVIGGHKDHEQLTERFGRLGVRDLIFNLLRIQNHLVIPDGLRLFDDRIVSAPVPREFRLREQRLEWYEEIAAYCGMPSNLAKEAYELDRKQWRELHY